MEKLPKDLIVLLALEMDTPSLLKFCNTSSKNNKLICGNETFWRLKIEKERPGVIPILQKVFKEEEGLNYKKLYQQLNGDDVYYDEETDTYIKGNFYDEDTYIKGNFYESGEMLDSGVPFSSSNQYYKLVFTRESLFGTDFQPDFFGTKDKILEAGLEEINFHLDGEDEQTILNYENKFKEDGYVSVDEEEVLFSLNMQPVKIV